VGRGTKDESTCCHIHVEGRKGEIKAKDREVRTVVTVSMFFIVFVGL
jgi:hypothetical protein